MTDYKALDDRIRSEAYLADRPGQMDRLLALAEAVEAMVAERDALRAQLVAMTTEWGATVVGKGPIDVEDEDHARAVSDGPIRQRRVGPWVEVTD